MTDHSVTRRGVVSRSACLATAGLAAALAGCGGDGDGSGAGAGGTGDGGTATTEPTETETDTETETPTAAPQPSTLRVVEATGADLNAEGVGTVHITVGPTEAAETVNLQAVTVRFQGPSASTTLWHEATSGSTSSVFRTNAVDDESQSGSFLSEADDRSRISFDLGTGGAVDRLRPSDTATVELRTEGGGSTSIELVAPSSLGDQETVALYNQTG